MERSFRTGLSGRVCRMGGEMNSLQKMAEIALTICRVNMTQEERNAAKSFADCHDCFDADLALYGAIAGEFFREYDGETDTKTANAVADLLDSHIKEGKLK